MNKIFYVCCILHNFIVNSGEPLPYGSIDDILAENTVNSDES